MNRESQQRCRASYDAVAAEYTARIFGELQHKPFDRDLLDRFAAEVGQRGPVYDVGCGPGHVTRFLAERGIRITGLDLSPVMIRQAQQLSPKVEFVAGDMANLDVPDGSLAGIVAFYSIIHLPPESLGRVFAEFARALQDRGQLLIAFHIGETVVHLDDWWGKAVDVDFFFLDPRVIEQQLVGSGFTLRESLRREPYPDVEHQSRRAYLWAQKGGAAQIPPGI